MAVRRLPLWAKIVTAVVLPLVVVIGLAIALAPRIVKRVIEREGSAKLHRRVTIHGSVFIDWSLTPRITLNRLTVANPPWAHGPMVTVRQLRVRLALLPLLHGHVLLPSLVLRRPMIHLDKPAPARANWVFAKPPSSTHKSYATPRIGRLVITHGHITVRDVPASTDLALNIRSAQPPTLLLLSGRGRYKGSPFTLAGALGSPTQVENDRSPYPVRVTVHIGHFLARLEGTLIAPMALKNVHLHVLLEGSGLGRVNKAIDLPLPQTGPFKISGTLTRPGKAWMLTHFHGQIGKSDLEGTISVKLGRPTVMRAHLISHQLNFKDLAGFVQAKPKTVNGHVTVTAHAQDAKKALPAKPYKRSPLMNLDADVVLRGEHVYASHMRIQDLYAHLVIRHGIVHLAPLNFGVADGLVAANTTMNVSRPVYRTDLKAVARGLRLRLLFPKIGFKAAGTGRIGGRLHLSGRGNSIAAMSADATGHVGLALANGSVNNLYVALAQLHVGNAALDWFSGMKQERIPCAVIRLGAHHGLVTMRTFLIDTPSANILGRGTVDMKNQVLHLTVYTKPKHITIVSARGPLHVGGTFKNPTFSVSRTALIERVGAAVALGALLTPAAALLPLIDTAPGHKVDCPALLRKAGPKARAEALRRITKRAKRS
ncbi:MAG: AsmA family protein [Acidiferrobacter sp.]